MYNFFSEQGLEKTAAFFEKYSIFIACSMLFLYYGLSALYGDFLFNVFSDRDLIRSFDILQYPLASSAEMSFSNTGMQNPGSSEYYIIRFFMIFSYSPRWIMFCIYSMFIASVYFFYKTLMNVTNKNALISYSLTIFYLSSSAVADQFAFIWNPAFVPLMSVLSVYFLSLCYKEKETKSQIYFMLLASFFAGLSMQMHISTGILIIFILSYIYFSNIDVIDKVKLLFAFIVSFLFSYLSYFLNKGVSSSIDHSSSSFISQSSTFIVIVCFLLFVTVLSNVVYLLCKRKKVAKKTLAWLFVYMACILYFVIPIVFYSDKDGGTDYYKYNEIPICFSSSVNSGKLTEMVNRMKKNNIKNISYFNNDGAISLYPPTSLNLKLTKSNDVLVNFTYKAYEKSLFLKIIDEKFSRINNNHYYNYYFIIIASVLLWLTAYSVVSNPFIRSVCFTSCFFSFVILFSFINSYFNRYGFVPFLFIIIGLSFFIKDFQINSLRTKNIFYFAVNFIFFMYLSVASNGVDASSLSSINNLKVINDYITKDNGVIKNASLFEINDGKVFRMRINNGISYSYLNKTKGIELSSSYADNSETCYAIYYDKKINKETLSNFYKRRIDKKSKITDYRESAVGGFFIASYHTSTLRCFTSFESKYIDIVSDSYVKGDNIIIEKYDFLDFKLKFEDNGTRVTLYSRRLRGLGYDSHKHSNNIISRLSLMLTSKQGKKFNFNLINGEQVGSLGLNSPVSFKLNGKLKSGEYSYQIITMSLRNSGKRFIFDHMNGDFDESIKKDLFGKSGFKGKVFIRNEQ